MKKKLNSSNSNKSSTIQIEPVLQQFRSNNSFMVKDKIINNDKDIIMS
jgi:hypothetical protein